MHIIMMILHVIGAGVFIGLVLLSLILVLRKPLTPEGLKILHAVRNIGPFVGVWQIITGLVLYFQEPEDFKGSVVFWVKIGLFVFDGLVALLLIDRKIASMVKNQSGKILLGSIPFWTIVNTATIITIVALGVILAVD